MCIYLNIYSFFIIIYLSYQQLYYTVVEFYLFIVNVLNFKISNYIYIYILINLMGCSTYLFILPTTQTSHLIEVFFISKKLWVGLIKFHPFLFYWTASTVLIKLFFNYKNIFKFYYNIYFMCFSGLGFLLGGFWSYNDRVWGYYWVNDPIELIYLLYWSIFIVKLHLNSYTKHIYYLKFMFLVVFFFFLSIRLKLINTKHSFIRFRGKWFFSYVILQIIYTLNVNLKKIKIKIPHKLYIFNWYYSLIPKLGNINITKIIFILFLVSYTYNYYNLLFIKNYLKITHLLLLVFILFWFLFFYKLYNIFLFFSKLPVKYSYKIFLNVYYNEYLIFIYKKINLLYIKVFVLFSFFSIYTVKIYSLKKIMLCVLYATNYLPVLFTILFYNCFILSLLYLVVFESNVFKTKKAYI